MNYERIYNYRFQGIDPGLKLATWKILAEFLYRKLNCPNSILDPAAGSCEFINQVPARERWAIDQSQLTLAHANPDIKTLVGDNRLVQIPHEHFDAVFVSNFLEHLHSQEDVAAFLTRMCEALRPGGRIAVMGPNFRYCYKNYFDFADHTTILSDLSVAEHIYGAGLKPREIHPRFLPLSFRGKLPPSEFLVKLYLKFPFAWRILGKQFLIIGEKK